MRELLADVCRSPQSNQRGIETAILSRLKSEVEEPQSNQRGIETEIPLFHRLPKLASLNRTSVGLKHPRGDQKGSDLVEPQSNQRGIETEAFSRASTRRRRASIEPAWD